MQRNTSVTIGDHFQSFIHRKIDEGRFESISEAVRAGLRLLEAEEIKLSLLREKLSEGEAQLNQQQGVDGEAFMADLISKNV